LCPAGGLINGWKPALGQIPVVTLGPDHYDADITARR
jgi:hypothetical protein